MAAVLVMGITVSAFFLVAAMGLSWSVKWRFYLFRRPGLLARSLLSVSVIMPLLAAALGAVMGLPGALVIALVSLGASPVPPNLPGKQLAEGGHEEYAYGLTFALLAFAIVVIPVTVGAIGVAYGVRAEVKPGDVLRVLATSVYLPLAAGLLVRFVAPAFAARIAPKVGKLAGLLLLVCFAPLFVLLLPAIAAAVRENPVASIVAVVLFSVAGFAVGHALGGPRDDHRTVLALATGSRHPAFAIAIAKAAFPENRAAVALIIFTLVVSGLASAAYVALRHRTGDLAGRRVREQSP